MPYKDPEKRRECKRKTGQTYRNKNREALNAKARIKYHLNKPPPKPKKPPKTAEEKLAYQREYYAKNRDKALMASKEWNKKNPDYYKEWLQKNKEKVKEWRKKYTQENREKINAQASAQQKRRFLANPEKIKAARKLSKAKQKAKDPQKYNAMCNEIGRRQYKKMSAELRDSYVKLILSKGGVIGRIPADCIPQELIEAKRVEIQIRRYLNEERN